MPPVRPELLNDGAGNGWNRALLRKETALAIQVIASGEKTVVFGTESFDRPEELAQQGYDAVYAVAVEFFDQTEEDVTPSLSPAP